MSKPQIYLGRSRVRLEDDKVASVDGVCLNDHVTLQEAVELIRKMVFARTTLHGLRVLVISKFEIRIYFPYNVTIVDGEAQIDLVNLSRSHGWYFQLKARDPDQQEELFDFVDLITVGLDDFVSDSARELAPTF